MKVAIIDADLIGINKHRFPNLALMKISSYHKLQGPEVSLIRMPETIQGARKHHDNRTNKTKSKFTRV